MNTSQVNISPVLVVGATGLLGTEICRQLTQKGLSVRGLVRTSSDPDKIQALQQMGVQTVAGDLKNRASLKAATQGVATVITTASSTLSRQAGDSIRSVDLEGQLNLVEIAEKAGVRTFVLLSFGAIPGEFPLQTAKRSVEDRLKATTMTYTILQPTMFMEVWLSPALGFDYPHAKATVYGPGTGKSSWIAVKDVAAFAVAALDSPAARNASIELGGPEALSPLDVIRIFEAESGRSFAVTHVPVEALEAQKAAATDPLQQSFTALMLSYAAGNPIPMEETLRKIPVALTSVQEYARQMMPAQPAEM
jgi:uncharacterized protein YbjT (DUF2867 family)